MIKAIKFASIPVKDQDKSLAFWTEKMGFRVVTDSPFDGKQRWIELAIPRAETRMRLACAWPLLIGLSTLDLLARSPNWLDPAVTLKVPRIRVYGLIARSAATIWSTRALERQARRLRERICL